MEVCKGSTTSHESDMGVPYTNAIFIMCGVGRNSFITMEGSEHICGGNAKVGAPQLISMMAGDITSSQS